MSLTIGLEKEMFYFDQEGQFITSPSIELPIDECGWLLEARGNPHSSVEDAILSLRKEERKIVKKAKARGIKTSDEPVLKISKYKIREFLEKYGKDVPSYRNYLGHESHNNENGEYVAGVHVSFMNNVDKYSYDYKLFQDLQSGELEVKPIKEKSGSYCKNFDWVKIFVGLDKAFEKEIKEAKRVPGMYELKHDGRVEYRSLPSNVDLDKLEEILTKLI